MRYPLVIFVLIIAISITTASCRKPENAKVERDEEAHSSTHMQKGLAKAMKNASRTTRRLARAVKSNDWAEIDMWADELKESIGFNCVELYMIENNDVSNEFMVLSSKFNSALNKLILCSKEQDTNNASLEFTNLVKSCNACHDSFNKDAEAKLDFTDSKQR